MRSILRATHAGSFRTRLTDIEVFFIPADRHRTDVTPTLRQCLQEAHPVVPATSPGIGTWPPLTR